MIKGKPAGCTHTAMMTAVWLGRLLPDALIVGILHQWTSLACPRYRRWLLHFKQTVASSLPCIARSDRRRTCSCSLVSPREKWACSHHTRRVCWTSRKNGNCAVVVERDVYYEVECPCSAGDGGQPGCFRLQEHVTVVHIDCCNHKIPSASYSNHVTLSALCSVLTKRDRAYDKQDGTEEHACWPYTVGELGECILEAMKAREYRAGDALQHSRFMGRWMAIWWKGKLRNAVRWRRMISRWLQTRDGI